MGRATTNPVGDFVTFTLGGCLFGGGVFLFMNQVMVHSATGGGYRSWNRLPGWGGAPLLPWGTPGMGLLMIPLAIGVCMLLAGSWQRLARLLVWGSLAALFVGVLNSIRISFIPSTLWQLTIYVVMIASGGGLMFRGLAAYQESAAQRAPTEETPNRDDARELRRELEELKRRMDGMQQ